MLFPAPLEVTWSITNRCNLVCRFCLSDAHTDCHDEIMPWEMNRIVEEIIEARVLNLFITGGEPLLVPALPDYVKQFRDAGVHVTITTNGTLLSRERVAALQEAGVNHIQVSINGSTAKINDPLMSPSYDRILQGIRNLQEAGIPPRIKVTVTDQNIHDMPELIRLLDDFDTEHIRLFEVGPIGRGYMHYEDLRPAVPQMTALAGWMQAHGETLRNKVEFLSFTLGTLEDGRSAACSLGNPDICSCQILHNGNLVQCTYAQVFPDRNNILEHGLSGAWQRLTQFSHYLDAEQLTGKCGHCEWKYECKGGCRALAYQEGKGCWAEDPLCPHVPQRVGGLL